MKRITLSIMAAFFSLSVQTIAQNKDGFILNGEFKGLPDRTKLYLRTQEQDTIAKTMSKGNKFTFYGKLPLNGRFHFIVMDTLVSKIGTKAIFLENKTIGVSGVVGSRDVKVTGSQAQIDYDQVLENILKIKDGERQIAIRDQWILTHRESLVAPWFIQSMNNDEMQNAYNALSNAVKGSYYGSELKKTLAGIEAGKKIKPGKIIPDFNLTTLKGKSFSVIDHAKKSKITLIDFWASWCSPCRAEIPNMKKVYKAFHDKGFNIIGSSTDKSEIDWKKAIAEDNTPWLQGRDNLEKAANNIFTIGAIPAFALIDDEGKLLAFSCGMSSVASFGPPIRGEELYKTIETLLIGR